MTSRPRRLFRSTRGHPALLVLAVLFMLVPAMGSLAQGLPIQPITPLQPFSTPTPTPLPGRDTPVGVATEIPTIPPRATDVPVVPTEEPPTAELEPTGEAAEPPVQALEAASSLLATLQICPEGIDPSTIASPDACTQTYDGATFTLASTDPTIPVQTAATGASQGGIAEFASVVPGEYTLSLGLPPGYASAFLWVCVDLNTGDTLAAPPMVIGSDAVIPVGAGQAISCGWYIVLDTPTWTIDLTKMSCPEGTDRTADRSVLEQACVYPHEGVTFSTVDTEANERTGQTDASGHLSWADVILNYNDLIAIDEEVPAGYGEPAVWCANAPEAATDPANYPWAFVDTNGGFFELAPEGHQPRVFACTYYNIPTSPGDQVMTVYKLLCPPGVENDLTKVKEDECLQPGNGVEFTVTGTNGSDTQVTANGEATFGTMAGGTYELTETFPDGYDESSIECQGSGLWLGTGGSIHYPTVELELEGANFPFVCVVYNYPVEDKHNVVNLAKWECPPGTAHGLDYQDYQNACTTKQNNVAFTLTDDLGDHPGNTVDGAIAWTDVVTDQAGKFTLNETVPDGFSAPESFCWPQDGFAGPDEGVRGNTTLEVPRGPSTDTWKYRCAWFNIPEGDGGGTGTVSIEKHGCPVYTPPGNIEGVLLACQEDAGATDFTIDGPNGFTTMVQTSGGDPNSVDVPGVPFGELTIIESVPAGFGEPLVLCDILPHNTSADFSPAPVSGGSATVDLDEAEGTHLVCHVFNMPPPDDDNTVIIEKHACPADLVVAVDDVVGLTNGCPVLSDPVNFSLWSGSGQTNTNTVNGKITFTNVVEGPIAIQESIPDIYGEPIVACYAFDGWIFMDVTNGYMETDFDGTNGELTCRWFNIPGDEPSITILKWTCPAGYDPLAAGADPATNCPEATNGIEFHFGSDVDAQYAQSQVTGDVIDGGVVFDNLIPQTWIITEDVPAGIASVFVTECTGHIMGQLQPYPLSTAESLTIGLAAGEHLTCHWYNVPEGDPDTGDLTVIKYTCGTEMFVSDVECQIFEDGQGFDLSGWDGDSYEFIESRTTDGIGEIHWSGLGPRTYWLDEQDASWCHVESSVDAPDDVNGFVVNAGEETVVTVYNCDGEPGKPGDTPTKYPDTGVGPDAPDRDLPLPALSLVATLACSWLTRSGSRLRAATFGAKGHGQIGLSGRE